MPPTNACINEFGDRNALSAAVKSLGRNVSQREKFQRAIACWKNRTNNVTRKNNVAVNTAASNANNAAKVAAAKANANAASAKSAANAAAKLKANTNAASIRNAVNAASKNLGLARANSIAANASVNAAKKALDVADGVYKNVNNVLARGNIINKAGNLKFTRSKFPKIKELAAAIGAKNYSWRRSRHAKQQVRNILLEHTNWWQ